MSSQSLLQKTVIFLGISEKGKFKPKATAFFVDFIDAGYHFTYIITAEHVISGILTKGYNIYARVNTADGGAVVFRINADFYYHPEAERIPTDIAVLPFFMNGLVIENNDESIPELDVVAIPLNWSGGMIVSESDLKESFKSPLGLDVTIAGLFISHHGRERNIPIIRKGNIAALCDEPVATRWGYIKSYLIEAMSIAGLSGSPVFVALPQIGEQPRAGLLGLIHGHFDISNLNSDSVIEDIESPTQGIHTGIGIVVPAEKILETIMQPELVEIRRLSAKNANSIIKGAVLDGE